MLCNYNYILNESIRSSIKLQITDRIIVIDEGHNIEDCLEEGSSLRLDTEDLEFTLKLKQSLELKQILLRLTNLKYY